jgi:hypothetical protein
VTPETSAARTVAEKPRLAATIAAKREFRFIISSLVLYIQKAHFCASRINKMQGIRGNVQIIQSYS